jgi:lactate permease
MLGSLAGIIVGGIWAMVRRKSAQVESAEPVTARAAIRKMLPYLFLILVIFAVNFLPFLNKALNHWVLSLKVPELTLTDGTQIPGGRTKGISVFGHPGAQLIYAAIIALLLAKARDSLPEGSGAKIRRGVLKSGLKSTLGIVSMMAMATTMQVGGMVATLATAMARLAGEFFPLISPWIGALGAFMTGSNTNSNVLLGAFQLQVAQALQMTVPLILAMHNAGAAVGSIFAPAKIIVGCSTVGLSGGESEALRSTVRYGVIVLAILAVVGLVLIRLIPASG